MLLPCEKSSLNEVHKNYSVGTIDFYSKILNYKRIDPKNDIIRIRVNTNTIEVHFNRLGDFKWSSLNGSETSYGIELRANNATVEDTEYGIKVHFTGIEDQGVFSTAFYVKELFEDSMHFDNTVFTNCATLCGTPNRILSQFGKASNVIIFETLLNITQHNYREHGIVEMDELFN